MSRYVNHAAKCAPCLQAGHPTLCCPVGIKLLATKVATIKVKGRPWRVEKHWRIDPGLAGECSYEHRLIRYVEGPGKRGTLDTLIHELLHAHAPDWSEARVKKTAATIAGVIVKAGLIE